MAHGATRHQGKVTRDHPGGGEAAVLRGALETVTKGANPRPIRHPRTAAAVTL